jgi:hypothetical protein
MMLMAIGAWFAQQVWHGQEKISERLNAMDVQSASVNASRFTASAYLCTAPLLNVCCAVRFPTG